MFNTGLGKYETSDIQNFTSDIGMRIRKRINPIWRRLLRLGTSRKVYVEEYPHLDPNKSYIFVANHSFDEDVISLVSTINRNVYLLHGSTNQLEHNPIFYAVWINGMIYVDRLNNDSRKSAVEKMKRVLNGGNSILLFPEGGYNNTENLLMCPLFSSPYILGSELEIEVVPIISFCPHESKEIYIHAAEPISMTGVNKEQGMAKIRDIMATIIWDMIERHTQPLIRKELVGDIHMDFMEQRKKVYECQKWYDDVWDEELTQYAGHNVTTPQMVRKDIDKIHIDAANAALLAKILVRREEDIKYNLKQYLREHIELVGK